MTETDSALAELIAKHGYPDLTAEQKSRIKRDYPGITARDLADFSEHFIGKRKLKNFHTAARLRSWMRIKENGHRRRTRYASDQELPEYDAEDVISRYK